MKKFKLVADEPRDVPALSLLDVQPGDVIEVRDTALSAGLEGQTDVWQHIPNPKRSRAAKKAVSKRSAARQHAQGGDLPPVAATGGDINDSQEG